jgi:hypothetical protein
LTSRTTRRRNSRLGKLKRLFGWSNATRPPKTLA